MAQLVAHLLCKQGVRGSSPLASTEGEGPRRTRITEAGGALSRVRDLPHTRGGPDDGGSPSGGDDAVVADQLADQNEVRVEHGGRDVVVSVADQVGLEVELEVEQGGESELEITLSW